MKTSKLNGFEAWAYESETPLINLLSILGSILFLLPIIIIGLIITLYKKIKREK